MTLRKVTVLVVAIAAMAPLATSALADAKCQLQKIAELKVLNDSGSPQVAVGINGREAPVIVDTGAAQTMLLTAAAKDLGLPLVSGPRGMTMYGAGGEAAVYETTVKRFEFGGASVPDLTLIVSGARRIGDAAGLLGWDLLSHWDVEFDLPHHAIRLLRPVGCHGDQVVYWADAYHRAALQRMTGDRVDIGLDVDLDHHAVEAILDSGAGTSFVTPTAARWAGVRTPSTGGGSSYGVGSKTFSYALAHFDSVGIGGEEVHNVELPVGDLFAAATYQETGSILNHRVETLPEMLLGADFLHAHRVLIAPDQNALYFTYEGGPVFAPPTLAAASTPPATPPAR